MAEPDDDRTINLRDCLNALTATHLERCFLQGCMPGLKDATACHYCGKRIDNPIGPIGLLGTPPIQPKSNR